MMISVKDASNYFRGLLLLTRKDKKIAQPEIDLMKRVGKQLGFDREFCENAIQEILENRFIVDEAPTFSAKEVAVKFIRDGLTLAFADNEFDAAEEQWLRSTAQRNGLDQESFLRDREVARKNRGVVTRLEVDDMTVGH